MLKNSRFIWFVLILIGASQSFASFTPKLNEIYQLVFALPVEGEAGEGDKIKALIAPDERLLVRVVEVDKKTVIDKAVQQINKIIKEDLAPQSKGLFSRARALFSSDKPAEVKPVVITPPPAVTQDIKYTFEVLHVFQGGDSSITGVLKEKYRAIKEDAKAAISKAFIAIQAKMPRLADPALRALAAAPDKFKSGSPIQLDQEMLDYFVSADQPPVLVGTWNVRPLADLKDLSLDVFGSVTTKSKTWKATIANNIKSATEASYTLGKALGNQIAVPGKDAALKVAEITLRQVIQMDILDLFSSGGLPSLGSFSKVMPSGVGLSPTDFGAVIAKAGGLILPAAEISAQLTIMAGEKFLDQLGDQLISLAKSVGAKFSSVTLPSIFKSEFSISDLKDNLASVEANLMILNRTFKNKMAEKTLGLLLEFRKSAIKLSSNASEIASSPQAVATFIQVKRAMEDAKSIYDSQSALEAAIKDLVQTVISAQPDLTAQVKTAFINGIKSGVVEKLSAGRLNAEELLLLKVAIEGLAVPILKEVKLARALKVKLEEGSPGFMDMVDLVKSTVGFTSGIEGAWAALTNFSNSAAKVMLRGIDG